MCPLRMEGVLTCCRKKKISGLHFYGGMRMTHPCPLSWYRPLVERLSLHEWRYLLTVSWNDVVVVDLVRHLRTQSPKPAVPDGGRAVRRGFIFSF